MKTSQRPENWTIASKLSGGLYSRLSGLYATSQVISLLHQCCCNRPGHTGVFSSLRSVKLRIIILCVIILRLVLNEKHVYYDQILVSLVWFNFSAMVILWRLALLF